MPPVTRSQTIKTIPLSLIVIKCPTADMAKYTHTYCSPNFFAQLNKTWKPLIDKSGTPYYYISFEKYDGVFILTSDQLITNDDNISICNTLRVALHIALKDIVNINIVETFNLSHVGIGNNIKTELNMSHLCNNITDIATKLSRNLGTSVSVNQDNIISLRGHFYLSDINKALHFD